MHFRLLSGLHNAENFHRMPTPQLSPHYYVIILIHIINMSITHFVMDIKLSQIIHYPNNFCVQCISARIIFLIMKDYFVSLEWSR